MKISKRTYCVAAFVLVATIVVVFTDSGNLLGKMLARNRMTRNIILDNKGNAFHTSVGDWEEGHGRSFKGSYIINKEPEEYHWAYFESPTMPQGNYDVYVTWPSNQLNSIPGELRMEEQLFSQIGEDGWQLSSKETVDLKNIREDVKIRGHSWMKAGTVILEDKGTIAVRAWDGDILVADAVWIVPQGTNMELYPECGDGELEGSEVCDEADMNGVACTAACGDTCTYCSMSCETETVTGPECSECGNGQTEGTEECDDGDDNGQVCTAACDGSCTYCTSSCTEETVQGDACTYSNTVTLHKVEVTDTNVIIEYSKDMEPGIACFHLWGERIKINFTHNYLCRNGDHLTVNIPHDKFINGVPAVGTQVQICEGNAKDPCSQFIAITSPGGGPVCGNGGKEGTEECDDGDDNGKVCTAACDGSCTYCTSSCTEETVQGDACKEPSLEILEPLSDTSVVPTEEYALRFTAPENPNPLFSYLDGFHFEVSIDGGSWNEITNGSMTAYQNDNEQYEIHYTYFETFAECLANNERCSTSNTFPTFKVAFCTKDQSYRPLKCNGDSIPRVYLPIQQNDSTLRFRITDAEDSSLTDVSPVISFGESEEACGNGGKEGTEQCDNGDDNGQVCTAEYGQECSYCSSECSTVTVTGAHCGDGTTNSGNGETCDDGNTTSGDGCSALCTTEGNTGTASCDRITLPAPSSTAWLTSGDLDKDGDIDLASLGAIAPGQGGTVISVYLNNGDGTFNPRTDFKPGGVYRDIALGDFDQDGDNDIVLGINSFDQQIAVISNNGHGEFEDSPLKISTGERHFYHEVSVGDVNGDGDPDVFAGGLYDGGTIFLGGQGMSFSPGPELGNSGGNQYHPTLVDVDNDGDLDAIGTPRGGIGTNIQVFINDGSGNFGEPANYGHSPMNPYTNNLLTGDVNGDGYVDLVQQPNGGGLYIWVNDGDGTFTEHPSNQSLGRDGAIADFTGDGVADLIGNNYTSPNYNFRKGNGNGTFANTTIVAMPKTGRDMISADLDGDGNMDIAQAMAESGNEIRIILGVKGCEGVEGDDGGGPVCGNGGKEGTEECDDGNDNGKACTAGYGQECSYCSDECSSVTVTGPRCGDGTVQTENGEACDDGSDNGKACTAGYGQECSYCSSECSSAIVTGPHCGDGTTDSADGEACDDGNTTSGDGCSSTCTNEHAAACNVDLLPSTSTPGWIASGDMDGDGDVDLATLGQTLPGQGSTTISIYLNNGNGTFKPRTDFKPGGVYRDIALGDFDQDGDKDIVLGINSSNHQLAVIANDGNGGFGASPVNVSTGGDHFYHEVSVGDVNGDGDPDVFAGGLYDGGTIFFGGQDLSFTVGPHLGSRGGNQWHPTLIDVDNDGDLDALGTPSGVNGTLIQVFKNNGGGTFAEPQDYAHSHSNPYTNNLFTGDLNGDNYVDLVQVPNSGDLFIWINDSDGTFTEGDTYSHQTGRDGALADFTGDGKLDLIWNNYVWENYNFRAGISNGKFADHTTLNMSTTGRDMVAADFNGDGSMDLAQVMAESGDNVRVILGVNQCLGGGNNKNAPECGNGQREGDEGCDDGNSNGQACTAGYEQECSYCSSECSTVTVTGPRCGDGKLVRGYGEECDDGNTKSGDGCSALCKTEGTSCILDSWKNLGEKFPDWGVYNPQPVVFQDKLWTIGGQHKYGRYDKVQSTTNGTSWTEKGTLPRRINGAAVVYKNKIWSIGGSNGVVAKDDVFFSSDGSTWQIGPPLPKTLSSPRALVFKNKIWVYGGKGAYTGTGERQIFSFNGTKWNEEGTIPENITSHMVVHNGKMWSLGQYGVLTSTNGKTWSQISTKDVTPYLSANIYSHIVHDGEIWSVGHFRSGEGRIGVAHTSDGVNWTQECDLDIPPASGSYGVVSYNGSIWIIGGTSQNDNNAGTKTVRYFLGTGHKAAATCGNGKVEQGEQCDVGGKNGQQCTPTGCGTSCTYCTNKCKLLATPGAACANTVALHNVERTNTSMVIQYSKDMDPGVACFHLFRAHGSKYNFTHNYLCKNGNKLTVTIPLEKFVGGTPEVGQEVKICDGNRNDPCSNTIAVKGQGGGTGGGGGNRPDTGDLVVVDDRDSGFSSTIDNWEQKTGKGFDGDHLSLHPNTKGNAMYKFTNLSEGTYKVYATWPTQPNARGNFFFYKETTGGMQYQGYSSNVVMSNDPTGYSAAKLQWEELNSVDLERSGSILVYFAGAAPLSIDAIGVLPVHSSAPSCGNGTVNTGEQCDNGEANGRICTAAYGQECRFCGSNCMWKILEGPRCGDGNTDRNYQEECDDGNRTNGDGCSSQCRLEPNTGAACGHDCILRNIQMYFGEGGNHFSIQKVVINAEEVLADVRTKNTHKNTDINQDGLTNYHDLRDIMQGLLELSDEGSKIWMVYTSLDLNRDLQITTEEAIEKRRQIEWQLRGDNSPESREILKLYNNVAELVIMMRR